MAARLPYLSSGAGLCLVLLLLFPCSSKAEVETDDPTRPTTSFDLRPHYEDDTTSTRLDRISLIFRGNTKWNLSGNWVVATRGEIPLTFSNAVTDTNPNGEYREGIGRPLVAAYAADVIDERTAYAFGSQLRAPASASAFGSGNWEFRPFLAARFMLPELSEGSYFVPLVRYAISFAQSFSSRSTSNLQFSPQLKFVLPDRWFVVLFPSPDIRINFGEKASGQTGRLFFPLDASVGYNLGDATVVSLEVSEPLVRSYPVYRFKMEARLSVQL